MEMGQHSFGHHKINTFIVAALFILVGILFLGRNLGIVDSYIFNIVVSWEMLLIVLGLIHLVKQHFTSGVVLIFIGGYFLYPDITGVEAEWLGTYWPVIFIIIGISLLFKRRNCCGGWHRHGNKGQNFSQGQSNSVDGFVTSDVTFGAVEQIVLEPVFKGGKISNTFGATVLDLRRTKLDAADTYLDVSCTFGGVEIQVPEDWNVVVEMDTTLSGYNDKRYRMAEHLSEQKLIIRGDLTFSGLEIKN